MVRMRVCSTLHAVWGRETLNLTVPCAARLQACQFACTLTDTGQTLFHGHGNCLHVHQTRRQGRTLL